MNGMPASEAGPNGLRITRLREDVATGAHSLILEAPPRAPGGSRPHFHLVSEEMFNLGPSMTFDAGRPLPRHGYARYPAQMRHGAAVDLPDGYRLFVRYGGAAEVHFAEPADFAEAEGHLFIPDPLADWAAHPGPALGERVSTRALSYAGGRGAFLARLGDGAVLDLDGRGEVELLVVEGVLDDAKGAAVDAGAYRFGGGGWGGGVGRGAGVGGVGGGEGEAARG
ncbi:hypothetical protein, partial [Polymorphobacter sp.]|uniref:hypothetical protein n=1 Tax=Polymorphobacter sp. TaxID=1909290 RepID=UPI003F713DB9